MRYPFVALVAAVGVTLAAPPAQAQQAPTVVRDGDDTLTCQQMADEAAELSAEMGEDGPGLLGRVRAVAETGAAILVPGAGLAMAGADALTTSKAERREAEAVTGRDRWNYLNGLYAGRGCNAPGTAEAVPATSTASEPRPPAITPAALF